MVELVRELVPPAVDAFLPRTMQGGRCLTATRIGHETLTYFGVESVPMPTRAIAVNGRWQAPDWRRAGKAAGPVIRAVRDRLNAVA